MEIQVRGSTTVLTGDVVRLEDILIRSIGVNKKEVLILNSTNEIMEVRTFFLPHIRQILHYFTQVKKDEAKQLKEESDLTLPDIDLKAMKFAYKLIPLFDKAISQDLETLLSNSSKTEIDKGLIEKYFVWEPLSHQQKAIDAVKAFRKTSSLRGVYLDASVGSGKTALSLMMAMGQDPDNVVIISPNVTIQNVWIKTLTTAGAFKHSQEYWEPRTGKPYKGEKFIIVNFESVNKIDRVVKSLGKDTVFIIDEAHGLSDTKTNIFTYVKEYIDTVQPKDVILMSGTPLKMVPKELMAIMLLIDPQFTEDVFEEYKKLFLGIPRALIRFIPITYAKYRIKVRVDMTGDSSRPKPLEEVFDIAPKHPKKFLISTIRKDMKDFIERREKEDKPNLPTYIERYIYLRNEALEESRLSKSDKKKYLRYTEKIREECTTGNTQTVLDEIAFVNGMDKRVLEPILDIEERKEFRIVKTYYKYPKLKYMGEALGNVVTRARIDASIAMAKEIEFDKYINESRKKTLCFSAYIEVAKTVESNIHHKGISIYGDNTKHTHTLVNKLETKEDIAYVSATYKALGTGIPVISCSTIIAIEKPFRDYLWTQAKGRIDREGQDGTTRIITFNMDTGDEPNIYNSTGKILVKSLENVLFMTSGENKNVDALTIDRTLEALQYEIEDFEELYNDEDNTTENIGADIPEQNTMSVGLRDILIELKQQSLLTKRKTIVELFTIPLEDTDHAKRVDGKWEIHVLNKKYLTEATYEMPPLSLEQPVIMKANDLSFLEQDVETTVGRFVLNYLLFEYGLSGKYKYVNKQFTYGDVSKHIVKSLTSNLNNKQPTDINLDDYKKLSIVVNYVRSFAQLIVLPATPLTTIPPKEFYTKREEMKAKLKKEHGSNWYNDDMVLIKFETDMMNFVKQMYKDDPSLGISMNKKALHAFKMRFVSIGVTQDMDKTKPTTNVLTTLEDGHQLNKESFTATNNSIRYGSSARASSTVFAGTMTKHIVLAMQSFKITEKDCKTKKKFKMILDNKYAKAISYMNFYYNGKEVTKDENTINDLIGKEIEVRLPHLCITKGDNYCRTCCGELLSMNEDGIPNAFIALSGFGMNYQLSKFHAVTMEIKHFELKDVF